LIWNGAGARVELWEQWNPWVLWQISTS